MREPLEIPMPRALDGHPAGEPVLDAIRAALGAADPAGCVARYVHRTGRFLVVGERPFDLDRYARVRIVGAGKAVEGMTRALVELVGDRVDAGIVVAKHRTTEHIGAVRVLEGDHPLPGPRSLHATNTILDFLADGRDDDLVLAPISGGTSALLSAPRMADYEAFARLTATLIERGIDIEELNAVRRALDRVKGGGLAWFASPATVVGLLLSDVPGDQPHAIGSGPTVPVAQGTAVPTARDVLRDHFPQPDPLVDAALEALAEPPIVPTEQVYNVVVGGNQNAMNAAATALGDAGFTAAFMPNPLVGDAAQCGAGLGRLLADAPDGWPALLPACLVAGGETTVDFAESDQAPRPGGRNLELALAAALALEGAPDRVLVALATDGDDGSSGAAGAVVTGTTAQRARDAGIDPERALARHDALTVFERLGDLLRTGPTGTNVCDVALMLAGTTGSGLAG